MKTDELREILRRLTYKGYDTSISVNEAISRIKSAGYVKVDIDGLRRILATMKLCPHCYYLTKELSAITKELRK